MKKCLKLLAFFCCTAMLLSACEKTTPTGAMGSENWTAWPQLTAGKIQAQKLQSLPWNSGRCEATSFYSMAETECGYYLSYFGQLYYADKSNLDNWVVVCNNPDCEHLDPNQCNSYIGAREFLATEDKIYIQSWSSFRNLYPAKATATILASMDADGTDRQFEYALEEIMTTTLCTYNTLLSPQQWLYCTLDFGTDGSFVPGFYQITEDGVKKCPTVEPGKNASASMGWAGYYYTLFGDPYFYCTLLGTDESLTSGQIFRFEDDTLHTLDIAKIPYDSGFTGGYISGDTLRCFRRNDGYYDVDLTTGEENKLMDARLKDSHCYLVLPNCMIETTLRYSSIAYRTEGMTHAMEFFDGEQWYSVKLPEELLHADVTTSVRVQSVVSDGIIFTVHRGKLVTELPLYYMALDTEEKALRYLGTVRMPLPVEE